MGWTYLTKNPNQSPESVLIADLGKYYQTMDLVLVDNVVYGAVTYVDNNELHTDGLVILLHYTAHPSYNFGYKLVWETMGPFEYKAPARILDKLTPTNSRHANIWRESCRNNKRPNYRA